MDKMRYQVIDDSGMDCGYFTCITKAIKAARFFRKTFKASFFVRSVELEMIVRKIKCSN